MGTKNKSSGTQVNPRGIAQGTTLVAHESGLPIDSIVDASDVRRLAVDANVTIGSAVVNVDIDSSTDNIAIRNSTDDNELYIDSQGRISIKLLDDTGSPFSISNPLPVSVISLSGLDVELSALDGDSVAVSGHETQIFVQNEVSVTSHAAYTSILTFAATDANSNISFIDITGPVEALAQIKLNGVIIRKGRIYSGERNLRFPFIEPRRIGVGDTITVEVRPEIAIPSFMVSAEFFSSLQGFIDT